MGRDPSNCNIINININTHQVDLPYIKIPNASFKFLIDTGSSKSIINPRLAHEKFEKYMETDPFEIHTAHRVSSHNYSVTIPLPREFNSAIRHKFYVFKFSDDYDVIIGIDLLSKLNAVLDFKNNIFKTENTSIPIYFNERNEQNKTQKIKLKREWNNIYIISS